MLLLLDQEIEDEEEEFVLREWSKIRRLEDGMYKKRANEGAFELLITKHLMDEEEKFKAYFRISRGKFASILHLIGEDLSVQPSNRIKSPITPAEKLGLTLR